VVREDSKSIFKSRSEDENKDFKTSIKEKMNIRVDI
jgi:hypothetical protein